MNYRPETLRIDTGTVLLLGSLLVCGHCYPDICKNFRWIGEKKYIVDKRLGKERDETRE